MKRPHRRWPGFERAFDRGTRAPVFSATAKYAINELSGILSTVASGRRSIERSEHVEKSYAKRAHRYTWPMGGSGFQRPTTGLPCLPFLRPRAPSVVEVPRRREPISRPHRGTSEGTDRRLTDRGRAHQGLPNIPTLGRRGCATPPRRLRCRGCSRLPDRDPPPRGTACTRARTARRPAGGPRRGRRARRGSRGRRWCRRSSG